MKDESEFGLYVEYEYDANGNTTKRTIYKEEGTEEIEFTYDTMNRLIKTTEGEEVTEYLYDNAGNRFIKKGSEGTTLYLRHGQIAVAMDVEVKAGGGGRTNRYVLSGDLIAGRIAKVLNTDNTITDEKSWYHLDHLNSTKCIIGESGSVEVSYRVTEDMKTLGDLMQDYSEGLDNGSVEMFVSVQTYRLKESDSLMYKESEGDRIGRTYMWISFMDKKTDTVTSILYGNVDDFDHWFDSGYPGVERKNGTNKSVCGEISGTITSKGIYGVNDGYTDAERGQEVNDVIRNFDEPGQNW